MHDLFLNTNLLRRPTVGTWTGALPTLAHDSDTTGWAPLILRPWALEEGLDLLVHLAALPDA